MAAEKLAQRAWEYTLFKLEDGTLVLSVLCGSAAMVELNIPLDQDIAARGLADPDFLKSYADEIRRHPAQYADRSMQL